MILFLEESCRYPVVVRVFSLRPVNKVTIVRRLISNYVIEFADCPFYGGKSSLDNLIGLVAVVSPLLANEFPCPIGYSPKSVIAHIAESMVISPPSDYRAALVDSLL